MADKFQNSLMIVLNWQVKFSILSGCSHQKQHCIKIGQHCWRRVASNIVEKIKYDLGGLVTVSVALWVLYNETTVVSYHSSDKPWAQNNVGPSVNVCRPSFGSVSYTVGTNCFFFFDNLACWISIGDSRARQLMKSFWLAVLLRARKEKTEVKKLTNG